VILACSTWNEIQYVDVPEVELEKIKDPCGAGDCMAGGFLAGLI